MFTIVLMNFAGPTKHKVKKKKTWDCFIGVCFFKKVGIINYYQASLLFIACQIQY